MRRLTTEEFIAKARKVHGDKYDYCKVLYINNITKVAIGCPTHGLFFQAPANHMVGNGCTKCVDHYSPTTTEFIQKAHNVHGNKYKWTKRVSKMPY